MRGMGLIAAALALALSVSAAAQEERPISHTIVVARKLFDGTDPDLSRAHVGELRAELETALRRARRVTTPGGTTVDEYGTRLSEVQSTLGRLSLYEGQPAAAERWFAEAERSLAEGRGEPSNQLEMRRARATAIALDGRFSAAADVMRETPVCAPGDTRCDPARRASDCMFLAQRVSTFADWDGVVFMLGPTDLCSAIALIEAAQRFEAQSRADMMEPLLRAAMFAAADAPNADPELPARVRWEAGRRLVELFLRTGRREEASRMLGSWQGDARLLETASKEISELAERMGSSAAPQSQDPSAAFAANQAERDAILRREPNALVPGILRLAAGERLSELYREASRLQHQAGNLERALHYNAIALNFSTRFIAPHHPLRMDMGPQGPTCPPGRAGEPECQQWYPDSVERYSHLFIAELFAERALLEVEAGRLEEAMLLDDFGRRVLRNWLTRNWANASQVRAALRSRQELDVRRLAMLHSLAQRGGAIGNRAQEHGFELAQLLQFNRVEAAVREALARTAFASAGLGPLLQERQLLQELQQQADPEDARRREELSTRLAALDRQLPFSAAELERRTSFVPLPLGEARRLLRSDEALLVVAAGPAETNIFVVTQERVSWRSVPRPEQWFRERVLRLRRGVDGGTDASSSFDRAAAFEIYRELLAPFEAQLQGKLLMVAGSGPLGEIPLGLLVVRQARGNVEAGDWLATRHPIVVLTSVAALERIQRQAAQRRDGFIGFGDPVTSDEQLQAYTVRTTGGRLVFAGDEIQRVAGAVPGPSRFYLREQATEAAVRAADLSSTRILLFATHALKVGEQGREEPGLVMSSGGRGGPTDDGYLSASEAAGLVVGADVVILSACNTASPNAAGEASLTGLAQSFLFAGARSVLATHWPVYDQAAADLIGRSMSSGGAFDPSSLARALQAEIRRTLQASTDPRVSHPRYWAPFVVLGG